MLDTLAVWLQSHTDLSESLVQERYSISKYLQRSHVYSAIGYPDLAAMDAYKAVLLSDAMLDESDEYHDDAVAAMRSDGTLKASNANPFPAEHIDLQTESKKCSKIALTELAYHLATIGCLRSAYSFIERAAAIEAEFERCNTVEKSILEKVKAHVLSKDSELNFSNFQRSSLPDRGSVRRQGYPWNVHEADRHSEEALKLLNREMRDVAPDLEVRVIELPALSSTSKFTSTQLGLFAKRNLLPQERVLNERSLLTASNVLHDSICDACSSALPNITAPELVECQDCDDTVFCSQACHDSAQGKYHNSVCGMGVEALAKDVPAVEAADSLYTLLLLRAMAMSQTQDIHPLDMKEVKYIWGDFALESELPEPLPPDTGSILKVMERGCEIYEAAPKTLPFTFEANILIPLNMLEKMDIKIFEVSHDLAETWVYNTLYAKFRGTASARLNHRSGRPEVAAVHPLWCLANHSCDPNVQWEWAGKIDFIVRNTRTAWRRKSESGAVALGRPEMPGGVVKGDEILNHYVDIELPVQERREWGAGALGGHCRCSRCEWEAFEAGEPSHAPK